MASAFDSIISLDALPTLSQQSTDDYTDIGIVKLADDGKIEIYNRFNTDNFLYQPHEVIGKNYFDDVVPCANNFLFRGRFFRGVESGQMDTEFDYTFTYKVLPTQVVVRLYRHPGTKTNWILIKKR